MKVAITGHTSGLGAALMRAFPQAEGFSRSNGFDINDVKKICDAIDNSDVFINNAHSNYAQVDILFEIWKRWSTQNKIIVCIGSVSNDGNKNHTNDYAVQKEALEKACDQLQNLNSNCKVILIKPGYINTNRVSAIKERKINADELAEYIKKLIEMSDTMWVSKVTVRPHK